MKSLSNALKFSVLVFLFMLILLDMTFKRPAQNQVAPEGVLVSESYFHFKRREKEYQKHLFCELEVIFG